MRIAGTRLAVIGAALAADPAVNSTGVAYPLGYGHELLKRGAAPPDRERLGRMAWRDVDNALTGARRAEADQVERLVTLEVERLDGLLRVAWPLAMAGNLKAIDTVLRIAERRARLMGLDAATRSEVRVLSDGVDAEIEQLIAGLSAKH